MATQAASLLLTGVGAAPAMIEFSSLEPSAYLFGERLPIAQLCFSQKKIEQLQKRRKTNQNSSSRVQNELVDCQCNFRVDEDIMVTGPEFNLDIIAYTRRSIARTVTLGSIYTATGI